VEIEVELALTAAKSADIYNAPENRGSLEVAVSTEAET
jgi:hypothetical protein